MTFTAMQGARLKVATELQTARNLILNTTSSIVWGDEEHIDLSDIAVRIDNLLNKLIPNAPTSRKSERQGQMPIKSPISK